MQLHHVEQHRAGFVRSEAEEVARRWSRRYGTAFVVRAPGVGKGLPTWYAEAPVHGPMPCGHELVTTYEHGREV